MKPIFLIISTCFTMHLQSQQTNYHFYHTDSTTTTAENIWQVWTDVPNWKAWDKGLKEACMDGDFTVGARGTLIPDKGSKAKFIISECLPVRSYTLKIKVPFGWLIIKRSLEQKEGKIFFTHEVRCTGLFKKAFGKKLGKNYRAMLPLVLAEIKLIAENK